MIQEGNYGDFHRGQIAEFAVEFYAPDLKPAPPAAPSARQLTHATYALAAEVVFLAEGVWVLDFGLQAFQEIHGTTPVGVQVGSFVAGGDVTLGVDPFFYFEGLYRQPGIPPLVHTWRIDRILLQTAPFIPGPMRAPAGQPILVRDPARLGWREIERTDAWRDDDGNAEYVLCCTRLPEPAKYTSATAIYP
jgi:hypothetical protein